VFPQVSHTFGRTAALMMHECAAMPHSRSYDVSVVLPFRDDEDVIGMAVRRLAAHLREYGVTFQIIAVDEDSGDNCHAVLALLRKDIPELRVITAGHRGRGFEAGVARAQGRALWLVEPLAAVGPLAPFGRAYRRVSRGEYDLVIVKQRFAICHRTRCLPILDGAKGKGAAFERRLVRRAQQRRLAVETQVLGGGSSGGLRVGRRLGERPWTRVFGVIAPARVDRNR
jgi:hypothetical protein